LMSGGKNQPPNHKHLKKEKEIKNEEKGWKPMPQLVNTNLVEGRKKGERKKRKQEIAGTSCQREFRKEREKKKCKGSRGTKRRGAIKKKGFDAPLTLPYASAHPH